jgi:hypothetical protein
MNLLRSSLVVLFASAIGTTIVLGDEWTSPDGVIAVTVPDSARFQRLNDLPESFLVLWVSNDQMVRLGVARLAVPAHTKLVRSAVEERFVQGIHGKLTASTSRLVDDHELWIMRAIGDIQGASVHATHAIAQHDDNAYNIVAISVGDAPADEAASEAFLNSVRILLPESKVQAISVGDASQTRDGISLHKISRNVGGVSMALLIAAIAWLVMRGKRKKSCDSVKDPREQSPE